MAIATEDEYGRIVNKRQQIEIKRKFKSIDKKHMKNKQKEKIKEMTKVTNWLRNVYGLGDNDVLTAGEVEELLQHYENTSVKKALDSIREETLRKVRSKMKLDYQTLRGSDGNTRELVISEKDFNNLKTK